MNKKIYIIIRTKYNHLMGAFVFFYYGYLLKLILLMLLTVNLFIFSQVFL